MGGYIALDDAASGARARVQARAARHLGAPRDAGAERAPQAADRARARRALRRGPGAAVSSLRPSRPSGRRGAQARVRIMAEETGAEAFLRQQQAIMTRPDLRPLLASIRVRRWCWSAMATSSRRRRSEEIAAGIAGSRLVIVADCGHLSTMERPEAATERSWNGWRADAGRGCRLAPCDAIDRHGIGPRPHRQHASHRGHPHRSWSLPALSQARERRTRPGRSRTGRRAR